MGDCRDDSRPFFVKNKRIMQEGMKLSIPISISKLLNGE